MQMYRIKNSRLILCKALLIVALCSFSEAGYSQFFKNLFKKSDDSVYIEKYPTKITIRPFVSQQLMSVNFIDNNREKTVVYNPNVSVYTGVDFSYKILGFSLAVKIPPLPSVRERLGETKYFNFKFNVSTSHLGAEAFIQRYEGFYRFNQKDFNPAFSILSDTFPRIENLSVFNFGASIFFQKKKNFSTAAAFDQTKRQKKSIGSFLFSVSYLFTGIFNNDSLVPNRFINDFPNVSKYRSGIYNSIIFSPGYGYSFVIKEHFFATFIGYAGVGFQPQYNKYSDVSYLSMKMAYKLMFKAAAGYNGDVFFAGVSIGMDYNTINLAHMKVNVIPMFWKIGGGMRF